MASKSTSRNRRPPGSLQVITKRARGHEYRRWRWRTYRPGDLGLERVDVELGEHINALRTRVLIGLGELSAPLLMERWARWRFNHISELPAWTGLPDVARGHQRAWWWLELPRVPGDPVAIRFRSLEGSGYDFRWRFHREAVAKAVETGTELWRSLSDDPILRLAEIQWLIGQTGEQVDRCATFLLELRGQRRRGEINQRDFEADERRLLMDQDDWEGHRSDLERAWDLYLEAMVAAMPRPRREDDRRRILALSERHLIDGRQLARWRADHWDDGTLRWSVPVPD